MRGYKIQQMTIWNIFLTFSQKIGFEISCKLSPLPVLLYVGFPLKDTDFRNTFAITGSEIIRKAWSVVWNTVLKNRGLLNHHLSFTHTSSPYTPSVNKMPSFCAMAKKCNIFSFELHSNILNLHWNGDVFNKRFVISPRTGVFSCLAVTKTAKSDHPCIRRWFLFCICLKDGLIKWEIKLNKRLNYITQFWILAIMPKS